MPFEINNIQAGTPANTAVFNSRFNKIADKINDLDTNNLSKKAFNEIYSNQFSFTDGGFSSGLSTVEGTIIYSQTALVLYYAVNTDATDIGYKILNKNIKLKHTANRYYYSPTNLDIPVIFSAVRSTRRFYKPTFNYDTGTGEFHSSNGTSNGNEIPITSLETTRKMLVFFGVTINDSEGNAFAEGTTDFTDAVFSTGSIDFVYVTDEEYTAKYIEDLNPYNFKPRSNTKSYDVMVPLLWIDIAQANSDLNTRLFTGLDNDGLDLATVDYPGMFSYNLKFPGINYIKVANFMEIDEHTLDINFIDTNSDLSVNEATLFIESNVDLDVNLDSNQILHSIRTAIVRIWHENNNLHYKLLYDNNHSVNKNYFLAYYGKSDDDIGFRLNTSVTRRPTGASADKTFRRLTLNNVLSDVTSQTNVNNFTLSTPYRIFDKNIDLVVGNNFIDLLGSSADGGFYLYRNDFNYNAENDNFVFASSTLFEQRSILNRYVVFFMGIRLVDSAGNTLNADYSLDDITFSEILLTTRIIDVNLYNNRLGPTNLAFNQFAPRGVSGNPFDIAIPILWYYSGDELNFDNIHRAVTPPHNFGLDLDLELNVKFPGLDYYGIDAYGANDKLNLVQTDSGSSEEVAETTVFIKARNPINIELDGDEIIQQTKLSILKVWHYKTDLYYHIVYKDGATGGNTGGGSNNNPELSEAALKLLNSVEEEALKGDDTVNSLVDLPNSGQWLLGDDAITNNVQLNNLITTSTLTVTQPPGSRVFTNPNKITDSMTVVATETEKRKVFGFNYSFNSFGSDQILHLMELWNTDNKDYINFLSIINDNGTYQLVYRKYHHSGSIASDGRYRPNTSAKDLRDSDGNLEAYLHYNTANESVLFPISFNEPSFITVSSRRIFVTITLGSDRTHTSSATIDYTTDGTLPTGSTTINTDFANVLVDYTVTFEAINGAPNLKIVRNPATARSSNDYVAIRVQSLLDFRHQEDSSDLYDNIIIHNNIIPGNDYKLVLLLEEKVDSDTDMEIKYSPDGRSRNDILADNLQSDYDNLNFRFGDNGIELKNLVFLQIASETAASATPTHNKINEFYNNLNIKYLFGLDTPGSILHKQLKINSNIDLNPLSIFNIFNRDSIKDFVNFTYDFFDFTGATFQGYRFVAGNQHESWLHFTNLVTNPFNVSGLPEGLIAILFVHELTSLNKPSSIRLYYTGTDVAPNFNNVKLIIKYNNVEYNITGGSESTSTKVRTGIGSTNAFTTAGTFEYLDFSPSELPSNTELSRENILDNIEIAIIYTHGNAETKKNLWDIYPKPSDVSFDVNDIYTTHLGTGYYKGHKDSDYDVDDSNSVYYQATGTTAEKDAHVLNLRTGVEKADIGTVGDADYIQGQQDPLDFAIGDNNEIVIRFSNKLDGVKITKGAEYNSNNGELILPKGFYIVCAGLAVRNITNLPNAVNTSRLWANLEVEQSKDGEDDSEWFVRHSMNNYIRFAESAAPTDVLKKSLGSAAAVSVTSAVVADGIKKIRAKLNITSQVAGTYRIEGAHMHVYRLP